MLEDKLTALKQNLQGTEFAEVNLQGIRWTAVLFSPIVTEVPCISNQKDLISKGKCIAWDKADKQVKAKIFEAWKNLACQDNSVKHWTAKEIVERAIPEYLRFGWTGLAVKLNQALQDAKHCPSLAGLTDDLKKRLRQEALKQENTIKKSKKSLRRKKVKKHTGNICDVGASSLAQRRLWPPPPPFKQPHGQR